jgi:tRNA-specific 2-thiouridylase
VSGRGTESRVSGVGTPVLPPAGARVVVAMSGGVDSSVATALLVERGYEVVGISLRLAEERPGGQSSGCCSLEDFQDAARVAEALGVPHYVFDMREAFQRDVITPFVDEYLAGRTPSPCILCNRSIKFSALRKRAAELGAEWVATGHYARRDHDGTRFRLLQGRDPGKDQSYFLFEMDQNGLAHTLFPVGEMTKDEVRAYAVSRGIVTANKADSQEICFVPDGRYADFVEKVAAARTRAGDLVDGEGRVLGRHEGVHRYTVGQRRGLGIAHPEPLYVESVDAASGRVRVGERAALRRGGLVADGIVWTSGQALPDGASFDARIRYRHRGARASVFTPQPGTAELRFDEPVEAISPGQAVVFYRADEVLGGGWIRESLPVADDDLAAQSQTVAAQPATGGAR